MQDITASISNYREAARHLWNCHYLPYIGEQDPWDVRDSFAVVSVALFRSLVLEPVDRTDVDLWLEGLTNPTAMNGVFVHPSAPEVEILINRDRHTSSGYWDHPKNRIAQGEATILMSGFFDWEEIGFRDFRYLRVLIVSAPAEADIADHWALLDFANATVVIADRATV